MTALFLLLFGTIFPLRRDSLRGHNYNQSAAMDVPDLL